MNAVSIKRAEVLHAAASIRHASIVAPLVLQMVPGLQRVIEVGPVDSAWAAVFRRLGLSVEIAAPRINGESNRGYDDVRWVDLYRPFGVTERFGLCVAIETPTMVAPLQSEAFVANLCALSDVVLFALCDSGEESTERSGWLSNWVRLFDAAGFEFRDVLRPAVWYNPRVDWRFAEAVCCFVRRGAGVELQPLNASPIIDLVHPWSLLQPPLEDAASVIASLEAARARDQASIEALESQVAQLAEKLDQERLNAENGWELHNRLLAGLTDNQTEKEAAREEADRARTAAEGARASEIAALTRLDEVRRQLERLDADAKATKVEAANAMAREARLLSQLAELRGALSEANLKDARIRAEVESCRQQLSVREAVWAELDEANQRFATDRAKLVSELTLTQAKLADAIAQFDAIRGSLFWRITGPLRRAIGWMRGGKA